MPENVTGFQPTGNLKKSLIDLAYFDMFPRRSPTFFREEPIYLVVDVLDGVDSGFIVEDYPQFAKGPSVLVLQTDASGSPVHVLWGIPKGRTEPAVVVTAYRPDPTRWSDDFFRRKAR
jgi:Domain of unknown function (DUF4258)